MKTENAKTFEGWLNEVDAIRKEYWEANFTYKPYDPLTVKKGNKFNKLIDNGSVWAFVASKDGELKGVPYKAGDIFKPASWNAPAKHARGNVYEGFDFTYYGPHYLV